MERSGWTIGCMAQNLAGERAPGDPAWTERLERVFSSWTQAIAAALRQGGVDRKRAETLAGALLAALEGARTLARADRSARAFLRVADAFAAALS